MNRLDDLQSILGIVLPTNDPEVAFSNILTSIDALKEISELSTFLINFQKPWTKDQMADAVRIIEDHGFRVLYTFNEYEIAGKGLIPMNRIRNDSAMLLPGAMMYASVDDDMVFRYATPKTNKTAGQQYLDCIHYMLSNKECGVILMGGQLVKYPRKYVISPTSLTNSFLTNRGYILRAMNPKEGSYLPNDCLDLVGSDEDRVLAAYRLSKGYYPAKMGHSRTTHTGHSVIPGSELYEWNTSEILDKNNNKFIRDNYNPNYSGSSYNTHVVDTDMYFKNGGIDVYDSEVVDEYSIDYSKFKVRVSTIREVLSREY